jgi:hypothetical protein
LEVLGQLGWSNDIKVGIEFTRIAHPFPHYSVSGAVFVDGVRWEGTTVAIFKSH